MPLDKLSGMQARALLKKRKEEGVSNATANRALTTFKHFVGFARREGWLAFSQEKAIREVKRLSEPPERIRYLTDDERQRSMAALTPMPKLIVRTALLSGMRLGEILSLKLDQVDFAVGVITLTRTKNNKSRSVPMSEELALVLREAMMRSRAPHVFTSRLGKPYQVQSVSRMFARATKRAGIEKLRFHDLRHDFATRLRRQGVGLDIIGAILGHSVSGGPAKASGTYSAPTPAPTPGTYSGESLWHLFCSGSSVSVRVIFCHAQTYSHDLSLRLIDPRVR